MRSSALAAVFTLAFCAQSQASIDNICMDYAFKAFGPATGIGKPDNHMYTCPDIKRLHQLLTQQNNGQEPLSTPIEGVFDRTSQALRQNPEKPIEAISKFNGQCTEVSADLFKCETTPPPRPNAPQGATVYVTLKVDGADLKEIKGRTSMGQTLRSEADADNAQYNDAYIEMMVAVMAHIQNTKTPPRAAIGSDGDFITVVVRHPEAPSP